jgi:hypothetical protein
LGVILKIVFNGGEQVNNQEFPIVESSPILIDLLNQIRRMENERVDLLQVIASLRAERDEARREVCRNEANHLPTMADPRREAARRGWNCFKEDGK